MRLAPLPLTLLLTLATWSLAGCSGTSASKEIEVYDNYFEGGNQTIAAGTTIEFHNEGSRVHTVTIHFVGDPVTTTKLNTELDHDKSVEYTFAQPGTYHVWCTMHGTMTSGMAIVLTVE